MGFAEFVDSVGRAERTLAVRESDAVDPLLSLLEKTIDEDHVDVRDERSGDAALDLVELQDENGIAIATSTLADITDQLLLVNSDLYVTGARPLEGVETADAIAGLAGTTFSVAGRSKLLLIHISRHIESMALATGSGVLHAGFQSLSRIPTERGTLNAYERLADSGLLVHVYGRPDWEEVPIGDLVVHAHDDGEIPQSWLVVHDGDGDDDRKAALVAVETGPNEYDGYWTFDPDHVDEVLGYIEETYC